MRNPARIPKVLKVIKEEWSKVPDWRFGQWFFNMVISHIGDPFFIEDDDFIKLIKKKSIKKKLKIKKSRTSPTRKKI